jgi:hypothetical protein
MSLTRFLAAVMEAKSTPPNLDTGSRPSLTKRSRNDRSDILKAEASAGIVQPSSPSRNAMVAVGSLGRRLPDVGAGMVVTSVTSSPLPVELLGAKNEKSAPETAASYGGIVSGQRPRGPSDLAQIVITFRRKRQALHLPVPLRRPCSGRTSPDGAVGSAAAIRAPTFSVASRSGESSRWE